MKLIKVNCQYINMDAIDTVFDLPKDDELTFSYIGEGTRRFYGKERAALLKWLDANSDDVMAEDKLANDVTTATDGTYLVHSTKAQTT